MLSVAEVDDEEPIVFRAAEKADDERVLVEHRAVETAVSLGANHRILAAQRQQIAMQRERGRVVAPLGPIDLRAKKVDRIARVRNGRLRFGTDAWKL